MINTSESESYFKELDSLAKYLKENQDGILEQWEERLYDEEQATKLITLSREKFHDHVPVFLNIICERLRKKEGSPEDIARKHGAHRWEHGIDLREVSKEWGKLHEILVKYIHSASEDLSISLKVLNKAQLVIAQLIHEGIHNSINEFYELQDREAKAQMKDLETALSKKEYKGENLEQASHDLKGILFSLQIGFSLLEEQDLDDETKEILSEMSLAANSLEQLLNNLLDLFRLEAGEEELNVTTFDAASVLKDICASLRPLAEFKDLDLEYQGEESLQVKSDKGKLERITQNLLINALKYTEEGYVKVRWEREAEDDWNLIISDTGPGLTSTRAATLTTESEPSDLNENKSGEGIGLLIVRRLSKLLNGIIDLDTSPGEGTTFKLVFPIEHEES